MQHRPGRTKRAIACSRHHVKPQETLIWNSGQEFWAGIGFVGCRKYLLGFYICCSFLACWYIAVLRAHVMLFCAGLPLHALMATKIMHHALTFLRYSHDYTSSYFALIIPGCHALMSICSAIIITHYIMQSHSFLVSVIFCERREMYAR